LGLGALVDPLQNTLSGYVQAAAGLVQSLVTEVTNNTFNTDTAGRDRDQFINQERKKPNR